MRLFLNATATRKTTLLAKALEEMADASNEGAPIQSDHFQNCLYMVETLTAEIRWEMIQCQNSNLPPSSGPCA